MSSWGKPSVAMKPGSTRPTCTPFGASSICSASLQPASANFDAEYAPLLGRATRPATEETFTIELGAEARSTGRSSSVSRSTASKLRSMISRTFR